MLVGAGTSFTPDSSAMIMARERVQNAGVFDAVSTAVSAEFHDRLSNLSDHDSEAVILDCGAGTGWYSQSVLAALPHARGIAVDLSPAGLKRAAKHPRILALGWDVWQKLPVAQRSVAGLLNVFAPRNPVEYRRVLASGAPLVVVIPATEHLKELAELGLLGQQRDKRQHVIEQMRPHLGGPATVESIHQVVPVTSELAADLVMMGPAGHHQNAQQVLTSIQSSGTAEITISVEMITWNAPL